VLLLLGFLLLMPGVFSLPPIDRDEAFYAQSSRQMVESRNWIDIRYHNETRYKKPIGIYWLQAGTVQLAKALGYENAAQVIGLYRLPSLFAALLSIVLTAAIGARLFGAREGFLAGLLLASCLVFNVEARMAKTDSVLLACTLSCMLVLAKAYTRQGLPQPLKFKDFLLFWLPLGVGFLVKGPMILLAVAGTPLVLRFMGQDFKWLKALQPWLGVPIALLIVLPWLTAINLQSEGKFLEESAGKDLFRKIWQKPNWSGAPPGYHVLMSWAAMWPSVLAVWLALPWFWKNRKTPRLRFLIAWVLPVWVMFELVFTKLPHYVLPAYPALFVATAAWMTQKDHDGRPHRFWRTGCLIAFAFASIVLCLAPVIAPVLAEDQIFFFPIFFAGLALGLALAAIQLLRRDQRRLAAWPLILGGAIFVFALFRFLFLDMPSVFVSSRIAEKLEPPADCATTTLTIADYREPSLIFLTGNTTTLLFTGEDVALALSADPCLTAGITENQMSSFKETLDKLGIRADKLAEVKGFNYAKGSNTVVTLFRLAR
jgi:4-amino-4-deoxy-L-arabinose transferase-like glycosyltransferase